MKFKSFRLNLDEISYSAKCLLDELSLGKLGEMRLDEMPWIQVCSTESE